MTTTQERPTADLSFVHPRRPRSRRRWRRRTARPSGRPAGSCRRFRSSPPSRRGSCSPSTTSSHGCGSTTLPGPTEVGASIRLQLEAPVFYRHVLASLGRILTGFALAGAVGVLVGIAIGRSKTTAALVRPLDRGGPPGPGHRAGPDRHPALPDRRAGDRVHHRVRGVLPDHGGDDPRDEDAPSGMDRCGPDAGSEPMAGARARGLPRRDAVHLLRTLGQTWASPGSASSAPR